MQVIYFHSLPFGMAGPRPFRWKKFTWSNVIFQKKFYFLTFISPKNKTKEDYSKRTWSKVETYIFIEVAHFLMNTIKIRHYFAYLRNFKRALYRFKDWLTDRPTD